MSPVANQASQPFIPLWSHTHGIADTAIPAPDKFREHTWPLCTGLLQSAMTTSTLEYTIRVAG